MIGNHLLGTGGYCLTQTKENATEGARGARAVRRGLEVFAALRADRFAERLAMNRGTSSTSRTGRLTPAGRDSSITNRQIPQPLNPPEAIGVMLFGAAIVAAGWGAYLRSQ